MTYDEDRIKRFATLQLARLPGSRLRLYAGLLTFRNTTSNTCWPSLTTLSKLTGLSERTIRYASADLVRVGLIRKTYRGRGGQLYEFAQGAAFSFPEYVVQLQPAAEIQPPIPMAMPDPVDPVGNAARIRQQCGNNAAAIRQPLAANPAKMRQQIAAPSEPVSTYEPSVPTLVSNGHQRAGASPTTRTDGIGTDEWNRNSEHEAALQLAGNRHRDQVAAMVDRLRERLGAWPRDETTASLHVAGALVAGWSVDAMVEDLRAGSTSAAVRDRGAVILANLATMAVRRPPYSTPARTGRYWPAWCGLCDKDGRFAGPKLRCENCHPSVAGRLPEPDSRADGWARTKDATTTAATPVAGSQRPVQPSWLNPHSPMGLDVQASLDAFYARETALQPTGTTGD